MSKFLPRICSVSTAEVDWLSSVNSWTGSRVRVELRDWERREASRWRDPLKAKAPGISKLAASSHTCPLSPTKMLPCSPCLLQGEEQGLTIEETEQTIWESRLWLWLPMAYYSLFYTVLWAVSWQVAQDCPWPLSEGKCQPGCPTILSQVLPQGRIMGNICI